LQAGLQDKVSQQCMRMCAGVGTCMVCACPRGRISSSRELDALLLLLLQLLQVQGLALQHLTA
jgi:hypothetical protein